MENHTAKHFVLQLGSLISLYLSLSFLLVLLFGLINISFPDSTDTSWEITRTSESIRLGIAMVIVFFPTYIILTRIVNKNRRAVKEGNSYLSLTKWLIYLSLLAGGIAILVDLVTVIMTFLNGEITQRFILKAVSVLVVVGAAVYYYILDARGHWLKKEKKSVTYGIGAGIVVIGALIIGFMNISTPTEVREQKLDQTQVNDLMQIQWRIQDYRLTTGRLPTTINEMYSGVPKPEAPENRPEYSYSITEEGFNLCATFSTVSSFDDYSYARPMMGNTELGTIINPDNWEHGTGEVCFERIVK